MTRKIIFSHIVIAFTLCCLGTQASALPPVRDAAYNELTQKYFPMSPDEIHRFKTDAARQQEANSLPPGTPPKATSSVIPVSLKPGSHMQIVRVGQGLVSSLIFTDRAGHNWPIISYTVGDPKAFHINPDASNSNSPLLKQGILMIQGQKLYAQTNITVMLSGLNTPVSLLLFIGQKTWDYQSYIRIGKDGPNSKPGYNELSQAPNYLMDFVNGTPPESATQLNITGGNSNDQLWSYKDFYILRTTSTLMSPAYHAKVDSPGSPPTHVYQLTPAPSIMTSSDGRIMNIQVTEQ